MFAGDHPPPHFHAEHQAQRATFDFGGKILNGEIRSRTARRLIEKWALQNRVELEVNWRNIELGQPINRIAPLD
jgi:Domain of unknown function (DUF4160)